jgi:hypothetical protein
MRHATAQLRTRVGAARIINYVQAAAVDDASTNDDGEDSAVEQEVLDEEDGQGNGNWE